MITVNAIIQLMSSFCLRPSNRLLGNLLSVTYCYHSASVITSSLFQSKKVKRLSFVLVTLERNCREIVAQQSTYLTKGNHEKTLEAFLFVPIELRLGVKWQCKTDKKEM